MTALFRAIILAVALPVTSAIAQVSCFEYGDSLSCDGPNLSNRTITDFGNDRGIITDERGNVTPYTLNRSLSSREERERREREDRNIYQRLDRYDRDADWGRYGEREEW